MYKVQLRPDYILDIPRQGEDRLLLQLVRVLAQELWKHNISVNELIPGPVLTERVARTHAHRPGSVFQDDSEWIKAPEDVVPLALFLATHPDKGPTGQTYSLMRRDP